MRNLLLIIAISFVSACVPYSKNPLTNYDSDQMDASIIGTWFWKDDVDTGYIHIGIDEKSKLLKIVMLDIDKKGGLEFTEYSGHSSILNGNKYLNLKSMRTTKAVSENSRGYLFVKYIVNSESFGIALVNSKEVRKAIKNSTLKGELKNGIWITEEQLLLQEFFLEKDKILFPDMQFLKKLKPPEHSLK